MQKQKIKEKTNGKTTLEGTDTCCSDTCCTPATESEGYGKFAFPGTETCCEPTIEFHGRKSGSNCCSPSDTAIVY
jgi:hypothetical protein